MSNFSFSNIKIPDLSSKVKQAQSSIKIPKYSTEIPDFSTEIPDYDVDNLSSNIQSSIKDIKIDVPNIDTNVDTSNGGLFDTSDLDINKMLPNGTNLESNFEVPDINKIISTKFDSFFDSGIGSAINKIFPDLKKTIEESGIKDALKNSMPSIDDIKNDLKEDDVDFKLENIKIDTSKIEKPDFSGLDLDISKIFKEAKFNRKKG